MLSQRKDSKQISTELTVEYFSQAKSYNVRDIVNFGLLEETTAAEILDAQSYVDDEGKKQYKLNIRIDSDTAGKLHKANIYIPKKLRRTFGKKFSKIVEYNSALAQQISCSPEFRDALRSWDENLNPFVVHYKGLDSKKGFERKAYGTELDVIWGIAAYIKESLQMNKTGEEVSVVISKKLKEILSQNSCFAASPDSPYDKQNRKELRILANNAQLLFKGYDKCISGIKNQFRDQIRALVDLYGGSEWGEKIQAYAQRVEEFLRS